MFLGDGYLKHSDGDTTMAVAVDRTDEVLVEEIRRVAKELFGLDFSLSADGFRLTARGTASLARYLELNGLGGTSHTKRVPDWAFGLPRSQRLALVAGLLDSDGYVRDHPTSEDAVFCSANPGLLGDVKELLALSGITSSRVIPVQNRHPFDRERIMRAYHLRLSGKFDRVPARSPRRTERMNARKYSHGYRTAKGTDFRAHTSEMLGFVRIDKIERAGVETVYDIEVAGHHNFVAEGFVVHNSEVVFHRNREDLAAQGVLFCDMDTAVREYPELVRKWFGTIIPPNDNKFAALNSAVWSGGSFIYVPPGVKVEMPLQAYFRINAENMGQFERTLIIADEGSQVHYIEGCSAPVYSTDSLHSAVVELVALPGSRITYTTIQNWSNNVYNLVTKRARAEAEAHVEWIDGNIGSRLTMKYPSVYLMGPKASGEVLSVAYAGPGQHQDAGAKMVHAAPETTSTIVSKSISKDGGMTTYRGLVHVDEGANRGQVLRPLRRAAARRRVDLGDQALHGGGRARRPDRPRGHGVEGRRRPALLPHEQGAFREPGHGHDRERVHRADHPHPAHGVRGRVEPADRAADGGVRRLTGGAGAVDGPVGRDGTMERCPCVRSASTSRAAPMPRARWPASVCSTSLPRRRGAAPTTALATSAGWPTPAGCTAAWSSPPIEDEPDVAVPSRWSRCWGTPRTSSNAVAPDALAEVLAEDQEREGRRSGRWWRRRR